MSARFLFTCWPFTGHVFPQVSIAIALRERGHEVAFHTGETARTHIESEGFPIFPFDHVDEARAAGYVEVLELRTGRGRPPVRLLVHTFRRWLVETIPEQVADVRGIMARWQPDVVVADVAMWAPVVVLREADRIPVAVSTIFMGPLIPGPEAPPWGLGIPPPRSRPGRALSQRTTRLIESFGKGLRRRVDELRADHGLAGMGCSVNALTARMPLYLVPSLAELDYNRRDLPATVHYIGACLWHPPAAPGTTEWLDALPPDRPWVHVTEGTLRSGDQFLLRAAAQGLADGPWETILTGGPRREPSELGLPPSANIHAAPWLNHSELLPRCDAMVSTGGAGAIMAALKSAVPLVIVPTTWDKPDNARRVVEAGVGVRLSPRRCTPGRLRAAVQDVLSDPRYRANARRIAELLARAPGPAGAAELLETLASEKLDTRATLQAAGARNG
jgi:UDP:flavonoid glycosyltransferase YjiC (YdhE family)